MEYVYLIKCKENYKIGRAKDVQSRFSSLQVGNPDKLELIKYFATSNSKIDESNLHKLFKSKIRQGEWYQLNDSDIRHIIDYFKKNGKRIKIPVREYRRLSNFKNKSDEFFFPVYIKNVIRKETRPYCLNKSEEKFLLKRTDFYIDNYDIYSDYHLEALKDILFSEIHKERMKIRLNSLYIEENLASHPVEEKLIKSLTAMDNRIMTLKHTLTK